MAKYPIVQVITGVFLAAGAVLALGGCGKPKNQPPVIQGNIIIQPATVPVGGRASITAIATDPESDSIVYYWEAQRGTVPAGAQGDTIVYIAPDTSGLDRVTVTVSDGQGTATQQVQISVIGPTPTQTLNPTVTPTSVPKNTPTSTPIETPSSSPTSAPTPTDTPLPTATPRPTKTINESGIYCTDSGSGGIEAFAVDPPRAIAQLRIDMQQRATEFGYSLLGVEAYGPETGDTNLIARAAAIASSAQNDVHCTECFAEKATDGDTNTRWASEWFDPQWLEVILSEPQDVNRIVLEWEKAHAEKYCVSILAAYALNVKSRDIVSQTFSLRGGYTSQITDDIWVMVGPPGDNLWPQSLNACAGEGTAKVNGLWEVRVGVGGSGDVGRLFEIIVFTADDKASSLISETLQIWCQQGGYPGFRRDELPDGLTEHQRITVKRGSEGSSPSPDISNAKLPGQVTLDGINKGEVVSQSLTVSGIYTDVTAHIWVLTYAPDGHYYPQSTNACEGISTIQSDGLWEARITVGGDGDVGKPFDIIVVQANEDAHKIFKEREQIGCETGHFPGYLFIQLPQGIDQKANVSVTRQ